MDYSGYYNIILQKVTPPGRSFNGVDNEGNIYLLTRASGLTRESQIMQYKTFNAVEFNNGKVNPRRKKSNRQRSTEIIIAINYKIQITAVIIIQRCEKLRHRAEILMGWAARAHSGQVTWQVFFQPIRSKPEARSPSP